MNRSVPHLPCLIAMLLLSACGSEPVIVDNSKNAEFSRNTRLAMRAAVEIRADVGQVLSVQRAEVLPGIEARLAALRIDIEKLRALATAARGEDEAKATILAAFDRLLESSASVAGLRQHLDAIAKASTTPAADGPPSASEPVRLMTSSVQLFLEEVDSCRVTISSQLPKIDRLAKAR